MSWVIPGSIKSDELMYCVLCSEHRPAPLQILLVGWNEEQVNACYSACVDGASEYEYISPFGWPVGTSKNLDIGQFYEGYIRRLGDWHKRS
jgi:hypothetical protein